jgi:hypothetical protein
MLKLLILISIFPLTACGESEEKKLERLEQENKALVQQLIQQGNQQNTQVPQPTYIPQQSPVVQKDSGFSDMLIGGLVGHAIGSSGNNSSPNYYSQPRTVVRNNYIFKTVPKKPLSSSFNTDVMKSIPKPQEVKPVKKSGFFSSFRSSKPSSSSYKSSSSFKSSSNFRR